MTKLLGFIVAALVGTTSANAAPQSANKADDNACVFSRTVHDFKALDRNKLVIWAPSRKTAYLVEVGMPLLDLQWANRLGFVDSNGDGRLCGFGMDRIVVGGTSFPQRATIMGVTRLDEAHLAALEQEYKVKLTRTKKPVQPAGKEVK
jgi:hypothetical protein